MNSLTYYIFKHLDIYFIIIKIIKIKINIIIINIIIITNYHIIIIKVML